MAARFDRALDRFIEKCAHVKAVQNLITPEHDLEQVRCKLESYLETQAHSTSRADNSA